MRNALALFVPLLLAVLFTLYGLTVQHRQRLSGGTRGRVLSWAISGICFLVALVCAAIFAMRLQVEMILAG